VFLLSCNYRSEGEICIESRFRPCRVRSRSLGFINIIFQGYYSIFLQSNGLKFLGSGNFHKGFRDKSEAKEHIISNQIFSEIF